MAELGFTFDSSTVEPSTPYEPLPAGKYVMQAIESAIKDTKSGSGQYIELVMEVQDGDHAGRRHYERINFLNSNETAQRIGQQQLSGICRAAGVTTLSDTSQLEWVPVLANVKMTKRKDDPTQWENRVTYEPLDGGSATTVAAPAAPAAPPPRQAAPAAPAAAARPAPAARPTPAGGAPKPWERRKAG